MDHLPAIAVFTAHRENLRVQHRFQKRLRRHQLIRDAHELHRVLWQDIHAAHANRTEPGRRDHALRHLRRKPGIRQHRVRFAPQQI